MCHATTALRTILAVGLLTVPAATQNKPDFSGAWKMNAVKSDFGLLPGPTSIIRTITHVEPSIAIVEEQYAGPSVQTITRKYTTDGKDVTFDSGGAPVKGTAVWEGNTLIVTSNVEIAMLRFVDRMTLSEGGKLLTSVIRLTSPDGDIDLRVIFERQ
jgi:hypothetical protein